MANYYVIKRDDPSAEFDEKGYLVECQTLDEALILAAHIQADQIIDNRTNQVLNLKETIV